MAVPKENVLYLGIQTPIEIAVSGYSCRDLKVSCDNGSIGLQKRSCNVLITPSKKGTVSIFVKSKKTNKKLGTVVCPVGDLPLPVLQIAGKDHGDIRKGILAVQIGVTTVLKNFDFDIKYSIKGFTLIILRGDHAEAFQNESALFSQKAKDAINNIQNGDKIICSSIKCLLPDKRLVMLVPIELLITD